MIILASASPRRQELLSRITRDFQVVVSQVGEEVGSDDPDVVVAELARRKAAAVSRDYPHDVVIGCDTVVYALGEILGKPRDREDAARMMRMLAGRRHRVFTGVALMRDGRCLYERDLSEVVFTEITAGELERYLDRADIYDKAGAYAIQGAAGKFIRRIEGSCSGVMGLPVEMTYHMLLAFHPESLT